MNRLLLGYSLGSGAYQFVTIYHYDIVIELRIAWMSDVAV